MLEVELFGPPRLTRDGERVTVDTRKAIAVLSYLVVEGATTRDNLVGLLWPESSESRAKGTLRRTLSALRSTMGPDVIAADRTQVSVHPSVASDISRFESALRATEHHAHGSKDVCSKCLPLLEAALNEYSGDFLEGFHVRGAAEFDDWARTAAESLRLSCGRASERLAAGRAAAGDFAGAIETAQGWVALDPLHEPAHRYLMLLHGWAGDRAGAITTYRRCVAVLDEELGIGPLEETTELYEAILDEDLPPAPGMRRRVKAQRSAPAAPAPDLISRDDELRQMRAALSASTVVGQLVVVSGETWSGKTRMLEAYADLAAGDGHRVFRARGYRGEQSLPFGVAVQLLRSGDIGTKPDDSMPAWAVAELGRLIPTLASETTGAPEPPAAPDVWGEARLFDALALALSGSPNRSPLIAVDDVEWADNASLSFLSYLSHRLTQVRVVLAVAHAGRDRIESAALADLVDQEPKHAIELRPLTTLDLSSLVDSPARANKIIQDTGGIPLLVAEALRDEDAQVTPGVHPYLDNRLQRLDVLAAQVLAAAAVLGGTTSIARLLATSGRSVDELVEAVEDLVRSGLIREADDRDTIMFALGMARQIVYDATSPVRRQLLHGRAAAAIAEELHAADEARTAATIALHYRMSGKPGPAANWYSRAGDLARLQFAYAEAEDSYRSALALGAEEAGRLHLALGDLKLITGHHRTALSEFQIAAATSDVAASASAEHRIGEVHRRLGHFDLAARHFELAEADHPERWSLYSDWALLLARTKHPKQATDMGRKAVAAAAVTDQTGALARAHNVLGIVTEDDDKAVEQLRTALDLSGDDRVLRMAALNSLAYSTGRAGHIDDAVALVEEALGLAQHIGDRHREAALYNHLADLHHAAGRTPEAEQSLVEAVRLFADLESNEPEPELWLLAQW